MHFCVSAARVSFAGRAPAHFETSGARSPRKIGTNWFMPAFVKSRPGESGMREADGTIVWPCLAKKSRKLWRISAEVIRDVKAREQRGGGGLARGEFDANRSPFNRQSGRSEAGKGL